MVIECSQCHTRFRLAEEKVKPGGTKVRCSKCKTVFTVLPPQLEPDPEPVAVPQSEVSDDREDLDFGDFNMERLPGDEEEEESDFGHSPEVESADGAACPPASSSGLSEGEGAFSFEFEDGAASEESFPSGKEAFSFSDEPESAFAQEHICHEEAPGAEEPAFYQGDVPEGFEFNFGDETTPAREFSFGDDDSPAPPGELSFGEGESVEFSFEDGEAVGAFSFDAEKESSAVEDKPVWGEEDPFPPEKSVTDGTGGGAADLDFREMSFGEESAETVSSETRGESPYPEPASPPLPSEPRIAETAHEKIGVSPKREIPPPAPRRRSPFRGVLIFILLLLVALCGIAGFFYLHGGAPDFMRLADRLVAAGTSPADHGQIRVVDLSGSFANNREAGQLFVVRGKAVNGYPDARSAIALKGILYNKAGKPILQQTVFAGNPLDDQAIGNLPFAKIEESMHNQFGDSLANLNVASGKGIPFLIVFRNLPPDPAEFAVEVIDSKPGTKQ